MRSLAGLSVLTWVHLTPGRVSERGDGHRHCLLMGMHHSAMQFGDLAPDLLADAQFFKVHAIRPAVDHVFFPAAGLYGRDTAAG